ncbi:chlorhexidine efflux transporter [Desulfobacula sp.]|nr:chlorhexidine efflux transporter [Desulfobacula sp.]
MRTLRGRVVHALAFELLLLIFTPVIAWVFDKGKTWLGMTPRVNMS